MIAVNRRVVLKRAMALGLSAPAIAALLAACGGDDDDDTEGSSSTAEATSTATAETDEPTSEAEATSEPEESAEAGETASETASGGESQRGGMGELRLLWWQAPVILNRHFAIGPKDIDAARVIMEPLVDANDDGTFFPVLAKETPSYENGGLAEDGLSATVQLRQGVKWHDGEDFDADDVKFTYDWVKSEGNSPSTYGSYASVESVEVIDAYTVQINFKEITPGWMESLLLPIIPQHIMQDFMGADAEDAPFNLRPIGTGPYKLVDFNPGDQVRYEIFPDYWDPGKPHFDTVSLKGGGDAVSAARAVVQTGDADYAWNTQVEKQVLDSLAEQADVGELAASDGIGVEHIVVQFADPRTEVDGVFAEPSTQHPWQSDLAVRKAYALLCDRDSISEQLYGPLGSPAAVWLPAPERFVSKNLTYEFNVEKAAAMLDEAGWVLEDGVRQKDGVKIEILFQTSINTLRQKAQEIIKQAFEDAGMPVEIKATDASVFFSPDPGNPETSQHFYADIQMYSFSTYSPYPIDYMTGLISINPEVDIAQKSNNWSGYNTLRWRNDEYNELYTAAKTELDEERQIELFVKMNDIAVEDVAVIPLVLRAEGYAKALDLDIGSPSRWASNLYNISEWKRVESD